MNFKRHNHRRRASRITRRFSSQAAHASPRTEPLEGRTLLSSVVSLPISVPPAGTGSDGLGTDVYVAAGPDGNIWFTEQDNNKVGKMTPSGAVTEFTLPTADAEPEQIIAGPDGALWFIESGVDQIGRITTAGTISEFTLPSSDDSPQTLAAGPDGNVWFIDSGSNEIGKITPQGAVTEFPASADGSVELSEGIVTGSDGNIWFTAWDGDGNGQIDRMTTSGKVTTFPIDDDPYDMTLGPDGNLWVDGDSSVDRVTPQGVVTEFQLPNEDSPFGITPGPDGALWFGVDGETNNLGRITTSGAITEFSLPNAGADDYLNNIVSGPGNSLWYATETGWQITSFDPSDALLAGGESLDDTAGASTDDTVATFTDFAPGSDTSFYQASIDWGDGTSSAGTITATGSGQYSVSAPHQWDVGYFNVTVTITDTRPTAADPGGLAGRTAVANTSVEADAPTPVGTGIAVSAVAGQPFSGPVADFTNVVLSSLSDYSATIDWGDGHVTTGTLALDGNGGVTVSGSETFAASGTFNVTTQIYDYSNPPIIFQPGPWEPITTPIAVPGGSGGNATTEGSGGTTTPTAYSAGPIGTAGSTTTSTTTHRPSLYTPVSHKPTGSTGGTKKGATPAAVVAGSGGSGGASGGTIGGVAYPPIDILPIWGQFPGIGSATTTATVAVGEMNGSGYTVLPSVGQPFSDVIASFTVTDPNVNLADLQATVQWSDPGIPQFGTTSSTTPVDATITPTGNGTFTVSATNTFANPGIYHFVVQISENAADSGLARLVGVAYGEAFVPYPPGIFYPIVDPIPVAWAGSTIAAQTTAAPVSGTAGGGSGTSTGATYPALAEKITAKSVKLHAKAGHSFSGKLAVFSGVISSGRKATDFTGTIDWGDGTSTEATFVRSGKKLVVRGKHTFLTSGAATITLNLSQNLTPQAAESTQFPPPPIHLPTVQDDLVVAAAKHARL